jgi:CubicO group peptidase (beta-lactamase class C family)
MKISKALRWSGRWTASVAPGTVGGALLLVGGALTLVLAGVPGIAAIAQESGAGDTDRRGRLGAAAPTVDTAHVSAPYDPELLERMLERAELLTPLSSLVIARAGETLVEEYYRGMRADRSVNVKSVSKTLLSPLVGIAIRDGLLEGPDQRLDELLPETYDRLEAAGRFDARKRNVTLHHLLSMTTGIQGTSFGNYGAWVSSRNWVRDALRRPMECDPGRCWEYSTGNTHLLSVILSRQSGKTLRAYARDVFFGPLGIPLYEWDRDPQGYYLGGNNMAMRPRDLLKFGQLFLDRGRYEGEQLVPEEWIDLAWRPRNRSPWNGHRYGYLWWTEEWAGEVAHFAWGYGGQYVVVVPRLELVAVVTSSLARRQRGHTRDLRRFFDDFVVPAFAARP